MAEETTRYYHIAPADYVSDWGLLSFDRQEEMGWEPYWKWEEGEYLDTDVVCLSTTLDEALDFRLAAHRLPLLYLQYTTE